MIRTCRREPAPLVYSVPEAAALLRVHPVTIRRLIRRGNLAAVRVGARRLVPVAEVHRLATPGGRRGA